jgi:hypothetical protein
MPLPVLAHALERLQQGIVADGALRIAQVTEQVGSATGMPVRVTQEAQRLPRQTHVMMVGLAGIDANFPRFMRFGNPPAKRARLEVEFST